MKLVILNSIVPSPAGIVTSITGTKVVAVAALDLLVHLTPVFAYS